MVAAAEGKPAPDATRVAALLDDLGIAAAGGSPAHHWRARSPAMTADEAVAEEPEQQAREAESGDAWVRVRTDRLDRLVEMVGELVIAQAMIAQDSVVTSELDDAVRRKVGHAGKIIRELQDLSISLRMVPLKPTFRRLARVARDAAQRTGKRVSFVLRGEDTELDRTMVETLADPLVHMIRNAVDHGLEDAAGRAAAGKSGEGRIEVAAYHAGGNLVVEVSDDGRGLDRDVILEKAIRQGIAERDRNYTEHDIFQFIFAPGFSTAAEVTSLSGRGVGLDVVRRGVDSLRGRIEITSQRGAGSTFAIRLPLTLAITDGMLVRVATERFIIPTVNIQVSFRPEPKHLSTVTGSGELVLLRDQLLPVLRLYELFDLPGACEEACAGLLVVVGADERRCALLVDELLGQQQVVAKTLGSGVGKVHGVSGGAILGDGRVGLILDVQELIGLARESGVAA
jgi:two-component system chemotaxis sensor kinase CheA